MEQRIQLTHPAGKKAVSIDKLKYNNIKKSILDYLMNKGESTHTEIWNAVAKDFKKNKIKFEGSIQWYVEWVKLDLEGKKTISKVPQSSPVKYRLAKNK